MLFKLISFLYLLHVAASLSCRPCCEYKWINGTGVEECVKCPEVSPSDCTSGQLTKEACGCCNECAKAVGEVCNSQGWFGTCADGLSCYAPPPTIGEQWWAPSEAHCCCEKKIVKETEDVYILDKFSKNQTLDICLDNCVYRKEGEVSDDIYCFKQGNSHVVCN